MKRHGWNRKQGALVAVVVGLTLLAHEAWAGAKVFTGQGGFTTINGSVETNGNGNRDPFVLQIFSSGSECVRLAGISQGADLELTLVSPSGRTWQDDDSNGLLRPLIQAITDVRGWYIAILSHYAGAVTNADFSLSYGRFSSSSAQCAVPTPPRIFAPAEAGDAADAKPAESGTLRRGPANGPNAP